MKLKVSAVIITYNIDEKIIKVVNSIINQVENVIIVDNNSEKSTIKILNSFEQNTKIKVIYNNKNYGIAKALNVGIKRAKDLGSRWVLTMDHDSICNEKMIENMFSAIDTLKDKDKIAILAPRVYEIRKQKFISKEKELQKPYIDIKDCIQSGSLYNIEVFNKIGYFNEELFIYHVDYEFCERVLKAGYRVIQCNNTILNHEEGYKEKKKLLGITTYYNNYSDAAIYYITRNTVYMSRYYSITYIKRIIKDFVYILLFDKKRQEKIGYWNKGLKDGITNNLGEMELT